MAIKGCWRKYIIGNGILLSPTYTVTNYIGKTRLPRGQITRTSIVTNLALVLLLKLKYHTARITITNVHPMCMKSAYLKKKNHHKTPSLGHLWLQ